ncbi:MAG: radical SAM protein [Desulfarculaceae bacterium]|nr:radical SAM protein [Desulfarculaceae bacterium]
MQKRTVSFSRHASNLFFHILTNCNLRCEHCYINKEQHGAETLDIETVRKWLALFSDTKHETNVVFLGGEPTLHPDLAEAVKEAKTLGFQSVTIDTNGYLFHDILDRVTPKEADFISFSLDGATRKTNDAIRGNGCYDRCVTGIKNALSRGFSASVIYTVSNHNLHELAMMPELLKNMGVHRFFIQVNGLRGKSSGKTETPQVTREQWLQTVPKVVEKLARAGITVTWPKVFLDPDDRFECAALVSKNYFVFPNGRVYQCPLCEDYPLHSIEIKDDRLVKTSKISEQDLYQLSIPEGCVMNKLIQPGNISFNPDGSPEHRIACCMLKEEIRP